MGGIVTVTGKINNKPIDEKIKNNCVKLYRLDVDENYKVIGVVFGCDEMGLGLNYHVIGSAFVHIAGIPVDTLEGMVENETESVRVGGVRQRDNFVIANYHHEKAKRA